jgi:hypothetical protein
MMMMMMMIQINSLLFRLGTTATRPIKEKNKIRKKKIMLLTIPSVYV